MENVVYIAEHHCSKNHNLDEVATTELFSFNLEEGPTSR